MEFSKDIKKDLQKNIELQKKLNSKSGLIRQPLQLGSVGNDVELLQFALGLKEVNTDNAPQFGDSTQRGLIAYTNQKTINSWDLVKNIYKATVFRSGKNSVLTPQESFSIVSLLPQSSTPEILETFDIDVDTYQLRSSDVNVRTQYIKNVLIPKIKDAVQKYNSEMFQAKWMGVDLVDNNGKLKSAALLQKEIADKKSKQTVEGNKTPTSEEQLKNNNATYVFVGAVVGLAVGFFTGASLTRTAVYGLSGGIVGYVITSKK